MTHPESPRLVARPGIWERLQQAFSRKASAPPQPQPLPSPKVFGIGLSKTGTTTLGACFDILGLTNRTSYALDQTIQMIQGEIAPVLAYADPFDAFEDSPWFALYPEFARRYPDARFILTRRKDGQAWVKSALNHGSQSPQEAIERGEQFFGRLLPGVAIADIHDAHCARVRAFFADQPHRLLEVCWEEDASWEALCAFLDKPVPGVPFPHENKGKYDPGND